MKVLDENGLEYYHNRMKELLNINQLRVKKIVRVNADVLFLNPNFHDFSDIPVDTLLLTMVGTSGLSVSYYLRQTNNNYYLKVEASNGYSTNIYQGSTKSNMSLVYDEYTTFTTSYGNFAVVTYENEAYRNIFDNILRINKTF